jgi:hypothetical protein
MAIQWTKLFKQYKGQWLALKQDEKTVLASGKTASEAFSKALKKGYEKPVLTSMPDRIVSFVGLLHEIQL